MPTASKPAAPTPAPTLPPSAPHSGEGSDSAFQALLRQARAKPAAKDRIRDVPHRRK